jgi:ribonuclease D
MNISYIDQYDDLAAACKRMKSSPVICLDTEFHRESTYYSQLALVQVSDGENTLCIDPLALQDFAPLLGLLGDPHILKVFHACQQDMEIFLNRFECLPTPVFDTQIAAGLLGYGEQIGYAALIKTILNIDIDKSQTRTDWMKRPLNEKQINYAASDVYYLAQAYQIMVEQLKKLDRLQWLQDDFDELSQPQQYRPEPMHMWKKVKGRQQLRGEQLAILQVLAAWREQTAQHRDRPRRHILPDEALIDMCKQKPGSGRAILALRSLQKCRISKDDAEMLSQQLQQARRLPRSEWPSLPKKQPLNVNQDALADCLQGLIKLMAAEHQINPTLLASRKEVEALVTGERDLPLLHGWRLSHAGRQVLDFLDNRISLQARSNILVSVSA